jgi:hypothetical protein
MVKTPHPKEGCFEAVHPGTSWVEVPCGTVVERPMLPGESHPLGVLGGGDFLANVSSTISWAEGSFPYVTGVTSETDSLTGHANDFSLQLNSNFMTYNPSLGAASAAPLCSGASVPSNCMGWEQFVYATGSAFIQYWLINYGNACPWGWNSFNGSCWRNGSNAVSVPSQPITNLAHMTVSATVGSSDTITVTVGNNTLYSASQSNLMNLGAGWNSAEFNVFGWGNGSEAILNSGSTLVVQTLVDSATRTTNAPTCGTGSPTAEWTNVTLVPGSCCPIGGTHPGIQFAESNVSGAVAPACPLPAPSCGTTDGYAFTLAATASNSAGDWVHIDNLFSNGNPSAVVTATPVWWHPSTGGGGVYDNHPVGVFYDRGAGKWAVFNEDGAAMPLGAAFNVKIDTGTTVTATTSNVGGDSMLLNDSRLNGNPYATVLVTPNSTAGGTVTPVPVGVWYGGYYWYVFHEDASAIRVGEAFNVHVDTCTEAVTASAGNTSYDFMRISAPLADGNPNAQVFATPNWNPPGHGGAYDAHPIGVYYDPSSAKWTVYHQDLTAIAAGESYNVLVRQGGPFIPNTTMPGVSAGAFSQYSSGPNCFGSYNDYGPFQVCPNGSHIASISCQMAPGSNGTCSVTNQTATSAGLRVIASNNCFSGAQAQLMATCLSN